MAVVSSGTKCEEVCYEPYNWLQSAGNQLVKISRLPVSIQQAISRQLAQRSTGLIELNRPKNLSIVLDTIHTKKEPLQFL